MRFNDSHEEANIYVSIMIFDLNKHIVKSVCMPQIFYADVTLN